jgi:hypothetical protein
MSSVRAKWLVAALIAVTAVAVFLYGGVIARRVVVPDSWDYLGFTHDGRHPSRMKRIEINGIAYFVWLEPTSTEAQIFRAGSGPPVYIFDSAGTLVGWSPTTGDGEYAVFLGEAWRKGELVTSEEVRKRIEVRTRQAPLP